MAENHSPTNKIKGVRSRSIPCYAKPKECTLEVTTDRLALEKYVSEKQGAVGWYFKRPDAQFGRMD